MHTFGLTHPGRRPNNEDRLVVRTLPGDGALIAVADGMGGEAAGEIAAQIMADALESFLPGPAPATELARLTTTISERILAQAQANPAQEGMGTTVSAALLQGDQAHWVSLGDSRLYHYRAGQLRQISRDHSFLRELLEAGEMTEAEARTNPLRHVMDQCAGTPGAVPDVGEVRLELGDLVLVCTDGLHDKVADQDLASQLSVVAATTNDKATSLRNALMTLRDMALDAGGKDNITLAVALI